MADVHSVSMSRHSSAGVPYQDSSVHQESVSVRLPDGPTHIKSISEGVPFEDAGVVTHNHTRLVEILRDENTSLKKELNIYYQRVCKLMRVSPCSSITIINYLCMYAPCHTVLDGTGVRESERGSQTT